MFVLYIVISPSLDSACSPGALSESEAELDGEHNSVELPQKMSGSGNTANEQSAIRYIQVPE